MDDIVEYMYFRCYNCGNHALIARYEDPTTSTGSCKSCGSREWALYMTDVTKKEVFHSKLKGMSINHVVRGRIGDRLA